MKRVQRPARDKQPPSSASPVAEKKAPRAPRKVSASKPAASPLKPRAQASAPSKAQPTQASPKQPTKPAPAAATSRPESEPTKTAETAAKRLRRGLGTLGLGSLQRHLPTFTLAVERPRPGNSPAEAAGPLPALLTTGSVAQGCVDRTDLLLLRDGLHKLLALLDAPPPVAHEM